MKKGKKGKKPYKAVFYANDVYFLERKDKKRFPSDVEAIQQCIKDALAGDVYALKQIALCTGDATVRACLEDLE